MPKITIDDKQYEIKDDDTEKMQILNTLSLGSNSINLLNHIVQCVDAIQRGKTEELKNVLGVSNEKKKSS